MTCILNDRFPDQDVNLKIGTPVKCQLIKAVCDVKYSVQSYIHEATI